MKYRIMSNDVGPNAYSALAPVEAETLAEAKRKAVRRFGNLPTDPDRRDQTLRLLVIPESRLYLHDGQTGKIKAEAQQYVEEIP